MKYLFTVFKRGFSMGIGLRKYYFGWLPDYPDFRDYTISKDALSDKSLKAGKSASQGCGVLSLIFS